MCTTRELLHQIQRDQIWNLMIVHVCYSTVGLIWKFDWTWLLTRCFMNVANYILHQSRLPWLSTTKTIPHPRDLCKMIFPNIAGRSSKPSAIFLLIQGEGTLTSKPFFTLFVCMRDLTTPIAKIRELFILKRNSNFIFVIECNSAAPAQRFWDMDFKSCLQGITPNQFIQVLRKWDGTYFFPQFHGRLKI